jgi:hypothetical protein
MAETSAQAATARPVWRVDLGVAVFAVFAAAAFVAAGYELRAVALPAAAEAEGWAWAPVLGAFVTYLGSHALRCLRLYVILLDFERSFGRILRLYAALAVVGRLLPFKLGEIFRFTELTHLLGSARTALIAIATERWFDAVTLLAILVYALLLDPGVAAGTSVLVAALSMVAVLVALAYRGLSGLARYLRLLAATRSRSARGLAALKLARLLDSLSADVHRLLTGRAMVLAVASLAIWVLEIATMALLLSALAGASASGFVGDLLRALNTLLGNGTQAGASVQAYFLVTLVAIGVAFLPLTISYAITRRADWLAVRRASARPRYRRSPLKVAL